MLGFTDAGEYLAGTIRDLNEVLLTNQKLSSEDEDVLEESKDIQDESDLYFGAERIPMMKSRCLLRKAKVIAIQQKNPNMRAFRVTPTVKLIKHEYTFGIVGYRTIR